MDFEPTRSYKIKKCRPMLMMRQDSYNRAPQLVIGCPINSTMK
ncbi:type II toxin-antitoxin system PemK/MazF family toxin [Loigolactobacillus jiayinensis]|uniref:Type II toxin-antitoxin system PemK/MazF family toxin n=1 Tax=Loigolactobacillus jiayinensis TaxID=2486016 RepID=A0ABW1RGY7_9LACO